MELCNGWFVVEQKNCCREKDHKGPCCVEQHEASCPYLRGDLVDARCTCASVKEEGK